MHYDAALKAVELLDSLRAGGVPGERLSEVLESRNESLRSMNPESFVDALVATKMPRIFAESELHGDGSDWTQAELSLLGDIAFAVPCVAFDDGLHRHPSVHEEPVPVTLLFVPGALLQSENGVPVDWEECVVDEKLDFDGYFSLYERRLLPVFLYAQEQAAARGRRAFITVPGLGCGHFAGKFQGTLGPQLERVIERILRLHGHRLPDVAAVYYDAFSECESRRSRVGSTDLLVRPLNRIVAGLPQLCLPQSYAEEEDDYSDCDLFSVVAWDHASWPGNDFFIGSRLTDDGVKAAATSSMATITGYEGDYDPDSEGYLPPLPFHSWEELVRREGVQLRVRGLLKVYR